MRDKKRIVCGWGINDSDYVTQVCSDGRRVRTCPYFSKWSSMVSRVHSKAYLIKYPTYEDVNIIEDWKYFTVFKSWMQNQIWQEVDGENLCLDKDILQAGNKVYSPHTCVFVPNWMNAVFINRTNLTDSKLLGVSFNKRKQKYIAYCNSIENKSSHLGYFDNIETAHRAWQQAKILAVKAVINRYESLSCFREDVKIAMEGRIHTLMSDIENNEITREFR